jgi:hypothetical protein
MRQAAERRQGPVRLRKKTFRPPKICVPSVSIRPVYDGPVQLRNSGLKLSFRIWVSTAGPRPAVPAACTSTSASSLRGLSPPARHCPFQVVERGAAQGRTTCSAYSVRPLPDARVSHPSTGVRSRAATPQTSLSSPCPSASRLLATWGPICLWVPPSPSGRPLGRSSEGGGCRFQRAGIRESRLVIRTNLSANALVRDGVQRHAGPFAAGS